MKTFHDSYLGKIKKLATEFRLSEALREYEKYIETYPKDIVGYINYADALFKSNKLEEIEPILQKAEKLLSKKVNYYDVFYIKEIRLKLLVALEKYQEAYNYLLLNEKYFYDNNILLMYKIYLEKKIGKQMKSFPKQSYLKNQIVSYNDEMTLFHIKKQHLQEFADSFPLEEIYYGLKKQLPNELKIRTGLLADGYIFKILACGYDKGKLVDFVKVVTFGNSNEIITMFPYKNQERLEYMDFDVEMNVPTLKRTNQIDKFNKKYNQRINK